MPTQTALSTQTTDASTSHATTPTPGVHHAEAGPDRYTGVIVIHGIGDIKRNTTLEEAVNTLAYWFNHEAGLALRREGDGRLWLTAHLTDDPNPDAPAARAAMHLVAPSVPASTPEGEAALRLEFREVWWAESFGLPSVGATIKWAQVQFREQAKHLLVPISWRLGRARTAAHMRASEMPDSDRSSRAGRGDAARAVGSDQDQAADRPYANLTRAQRRLLRATLWLYGLLQYAWKAVQWLILTPLLFVLLLLLVPLRLLALIPPLRSTVIAGLSAVLQYVMLHWIAEVQVYALDYTRSAGIRERFEREVNAFLRDEQCDRLVVIAHSMGTVIAYEGLTNTLTHPDPDVQEMPPKPVTFICLAQALRRVWLVPVDDPQRLRRVLPDGVRWLHFWARYDPVAAGPLGPRSLPDQDPWLDLWADSTVPDPYAALRARLKRCENVGVINTDSTFTDHTTYWQNLEQVVGPIAAELVEGHPGLEQVVRQRLATPDEILWRRWRVAWRASLALAGGLAAGIGFFLWDWQGNPQPDLGQPPFGVGHALGTFFFPSLLQALWKSQKDGPIGLVLGLLEQALGAAYALFLNGINGITNAKSAQFELALPASLLDALYSAGTALTVSGLLIVGIGRLAAMPAPIAARRVRVGGVRQQAARRALALASMSFILLTSASLILFSIHFRLRYAGLQPSDYVPAVLRSDTAAQGAFYLGLLAGIAAVVLTLVDAGRSRNWGVYIPMLVLVVLLVAVYVARSLNVVPAALNDGLLNSLYFDFGSGEYVSLFHGHGILSFITTEAAGVALVGCILVLAQTARSRRWSLFATLLIIALLLAASLDVAYATLYDMVREIPGLREAVGTYASFATAVQDARVVVWASPAFVALIYGLWRYRTGRITTGRVTQPDTRGWRARLAFGLATVALAGLITASTLAFGLDQYSTGEVMLVGIGVLGAVVLSVFLVDVIRRRSWGWLAVVIVLGTNDLLWEISLGSSAWQPRVMFYLLVVVLPSAVAYGLWARAGTRTSLRTSPEPSEL